MIKLKEEFIELCSNEDTEAVNRTLSDGVGIERCIEIIETYPERKIDVAKKWNNSRRYYAHARFV